MKQLFAILLAAIALIASPAFAQDISGFQIDLSDPQKEPLTGIKGQKAPPLGVTEWINLPEGAERLGMSDFTDKVVVMLLWQSTCKASMIREFPVLKKLVRHFEGNPDVVFLAIQTPFQNYAENSDLKLKPVSEELGLDIPFGHLAKTKDAFSINVAYQTGGTPWWVVVDKDRTVVFNDFTMDPEIGKENIQKLIDGGSVE